jgi:diaminopimelate epimerase
MRFQKWQALGNDYLILEAASLPFPLTAARVRRLCDPHFGPGADGVLELSPPDEDRFVARLRIFNPDGSEAELSGNGARQAILYLRRAGWTSEDTFSIQTLAGEIRPTITGPATCRVDMGRASLVSEGEVAAGGRTWRFRHVAIGNPQTAIRVDEELEALDLAVLGPPIERSEQFPNRTNVSFWREVGAGEIRARIFERGVGETLSSGTGACGAAVAYVLGGGEGAGGSIIVHLDGGDLEVDVDADLRVHLTGWAVPVYAGELSEEFAADLEAS